jgi:hypothetical protein
VGFPLTTAGTVSGVVVVVVVVTERVGAGGGGAETMCDSGSAAHPARRPKAPQKTRKDGTLIFFVFIFKEYIRNRFGAMGCNPDVGRLASFLRYRT